MISSTTWMVFKQTAIPKRLLLSLRNVILTFFVFYTSIFLQSVNAQENSPRGKQGVLLSTREEVPVSDLIDYAAEQLGDKILYDDALANKKVRLIAPTPIAQDQFLNVLQNILIAEGLAISAPDQAGVRRITAAANLIELTNPQSTIEDLSKIEAAVPVTRLIKVKNFAPAKAIEILKPFLSDAGASIIGIENRDFIVVTDVAASVRRILDLVDLLDSGGPLVDVRFKNVDFIRVDELAKQLEDLIQARQNVLGQAENKGSGVEVRTNARTNQLILIGVPAELDQVEQLIKLLDTEISTTERSFTLQYVSPQRLDAVIREILSGRGVTAPYRSQAEGNVLIVDSTNEILEMADRVSRSLDTRQAPLSQSPIRFYKVKNVPANELAETLRSITGQSLQPEPTNLPPRRLTSNDAAVPGPNVSPLLNPGIAQPVQVPPTPPAMRGSVTQSGPDRRAVTSDLSQATSDPLTTNVPFELQANRVDVASNAIVNAAVNATVTVDLHSNSIIVLADPEVQRIYAGLIEALDQRRPQVLVEARIIIIDTSDNYSLGVEVSGGDRAGVKRLFAFSSYGLSEVDPVSGALQILPGIGFNGTLVDPSTADVVVRAIAQHRRARVLSTPRVLVNDNAEGQLTSVLEVPFTSINASQTVATTSFAGFAEAGTTITVRPTISDDNYLQLEYVVTLNSFSGPGSANVPPPRQTNEVRSRVTVPDGYTVIVGGLVSKNGSYEIDSIPFLEKIPIIRELSSLQSTSNNETSLFVFLRPVILREDKFKDLKYLSGIDSFKAKDAADYPPTLPILLE